MYHFAELRLMHSIETLSNSGGLLALSAAPDHTVLACPGLHAGQVKAALSRLLVAQPKPLSQPLPQSAGLLGLHA